MFEFAARRIGRQAARVLVGAMVTGIYAGDAHTLSLHAPGAAPLAGNSVWMDRLFLRRHMPRLEAHLHYRIVDVSTVKELVRRWTPDVAARLPAKAEKHRALEDIRESVAELAFYRSEAFR